MFIIIMTHRLSHAVMMMSNIHINQTYQLIKLNPSLKRNYLFILLLKINFTLSNLIIYSNI